MSETVKQLKKHHLQRLLGVGVILYLFVVTTPTYSVKLPCYAACIVPVANALGTATPTHLTQAYYDIPSMFDDSKPPYRRPGYSRIHQILFNDVVKVVELKDTQARIELPGVLYETTQAATPQVTAWVAAENLMCFSPHSTKLQQFPAPLSTDKEQFLKAITNTVVLTWPLYDPVTKLTFSIGTRFVHVATNADSYEVRCFNPTNRQMTTITVPKQIAYLFHPKSPQAQRELFLQLVTSWAHPKQGIIQYVHGGTSATEFITSKNFHSSTFDNYAGYDWNNDRPRTGIDCSGLIVRAAQIAGIPFFYKNSITMARRLKETKNPEPGDIIWIPGHVMVISKLDPALIVEARGYPSGYGLVQEIALPEMFRGVATFKQLIEGIPAKKPIERLQKDGSVSEIITEYKVLSLM
jgi:hypothetical protein